ncbi:MAG: hypothetical protein ACLRZQ_01450 [Akkermansia muciniphila]
MTRRPSDEPPARLRRKILKTVRKEKKKAVPRARNHAQARFTIFGALLFVLLMPFRFIGSLTRNIRWFICWPLRILLGCCFVGIVIGSILVFLYGAISNRYDISEVKSNIPERTVILDRKKPHHRHPARGKPQAGIPSGSSSHFY